MYPQQDIILAGVRMNISIISIISPLPQRVACIFLFLSSIVGPTMQEPTCTKPRQMQ